LPDETSLFGEAWEISAREEADSVVVGGTYAGRTLTALWSDPALRSAIFGEKAPEEERFPLLCKILDARDRLSIQVHPPADLAEQLGGEPKAEVWYIAEADPGAKLYVGVRHGVDEECFREALETGRAERCVHTIPVEKGEHIFIPGGRLHAIGAGLLIYEIQQNSDTTYRVYDWNRPGIDGKPRQLHVEESIKCIDFEDIEPEMDESGEGLLVECDYFRLEAHDLVPGESLLARTRGRFAVITVVDGEIYEGGTIFRTGDFFIVPAGTEGDGLVAENEAEILLTTWPLG
jgi:mannose-6-phosphate isomerase